MGGKYCTECGTPIIGRFCSNCGKRIKTSEEENYQQIFRAKKRFRDKYCSGPLQKIQGISMHRIAGCAFDLARAHGDSWIGDQYTTLTRKNCPVGSADAIMQNAEAIMRQMVPMLKRMTWVDVDD